MVICFRYSLDILTCPSLCLLTLFSCMQMWVCLRYRTPAVDIGGCLFTGNNTEETTYSQHPITILRAPRWIWFMIIPKHPGEDRDPDTGDPSVKIYGLTGKIASSRRIILNLTLITFFLFLEAGWSGERTLPFSWMMGWTVYLPSWPWAKHWGSNIFGNVNLLLQSGMSEACWRVKGEG